MRNFNSEKKHPLKTTQPLINTSQTEALTFIRGLPALLFVFRLKLLSQDSHPKLQDLKIF